MRSRLLGFSLLVGCRDWHDPLPFDECQPHALECEACVFDDDVASAPGTLLRVWECEDETFGPLLSIRRRAINVPASDTHFYDSETRLRVASVRTHDDVVPVCGRELTDEWWGEILDCVDLCEREPSLPESDPELEVCPEA